MPTVTQFNEEKAKAEIKKCPKIVRDYTKLLKEALTRQQELTAKAIGNLRKWSREPLSLEKFIELAKIVELSMQQDVNYTGSIVSGNFTGRFVDAYKEYLTKYCPDAIPVVQDVQKFMPLPAEYTTLLELASKIERGCDCEYDDRCSQCDRVVDLKRHIEQMTKGATKGPSDKLNKALEHVEQSQAVINNMELLLLGDVATLINILCDTNFTNEDLEYKPKAQPVGLAKMRREKGLCMAPLTCHCFKCLINGKTT